MGKQKLIKMAECRVQSGLFPEWTVPQDGFAFWNVTTSGVRMREILPGSE